MKEKSSAQLIADKYALLLTDPKISRHLAEKYQQRMNASMEVVALEGGEDWPLRA